MALPTPEPAAGLDAYRAERQLALARSAECAANYERYLAAKEDREATLDYLPIKLDIENVSRCNYRCTMCAVSNWHKGQRAPDMPLACFKRLIDEQYGLVEIKLQGLGEPTMQRDTFYEMIRYARERHIWVRTTTNASLLHIGGAAEKLIDADTNEVQISIDGATNDVFEGIRRGSVFERVKANCQLINDYSRVCNVNRTKMWTVVQRANVHQLEDLVWLGAELGFTNQVFSLDVHDWSGQLDTSADNVPPDEERLAGLIEIGRHMGVKVAFWTVGKKYDADNICPWPFERAFISSDMRVAPCCVIGNPDVMQIGPKVDHGFTNVWFSDEYSRFRQAHIEGQIPSACKGCYKTAA